MLIGDFDWNMIFGLPNVIFVLGCGVAAIGILASSWVSVQRNRSIVDLKMMLVERGLSAEEIATIVRAKPEGSSDDDE
jgi:hypothetical protein